MRSSGARLLAGQELVLPRCGELTERIPGNIPMEFRLLVYKGCVDGRPVTCLFDTGATS